MKAKTAVAGLGIVALALAFLPGVRRLWESDPSPSVEEALSAGPVPAGRASVPAEFDGSAGWALQDSSGRAGVMGSVAAPRAGVVVFHALALQGSNSYLVARDEKTGAVRWKTAPIPYPSGAFTRRSALFTEKDGKEYTGLSVADPKTAQTRLYVYDAASRGDRVAPAREIVVSGAQHVSSGHRDGLLVGRQDKATTVVDVTTGQSTTYPDQSAGLRPPRPCGGCADQDRAVGMTASGPLVKGTRAFWVPGAWFAGADADLAVTGLPTGQVLAASSAAGSASAQWTLLDGRTGQVQASATCRPPKTDGDGTLDYSASSDGRYVVSAGAGFDLLARRGFCFADPASPGEADLAAVDTSGTAYGTVRGEHASVSLRTGQVSPSPDVQLPDYVGGNVAVLGTTTNSGARIQVYQRRT
ncbi:hypothetical protein [Amycolatopsis sp. WGS_07]|uniref:hypothetical protein n=1 Tax=Amycolatopsis sp. WGS_07 TaxID=3076764 RepID=UPI003872C631